MELTLPLLYKWTTVILPLKDSTLFYHSVRRVCNFLVSILLLQRFEMSDQCYSSVTAQSFI